MTEEAVVISVDSTDVELAAARFDQLRGASEAAAGGLEDVGTAGEDAAEGLDDAADGAERLGRQSAGSTMSIGRLTAGILSGAVALQGIRAGLRFAGAALREYVAGNAEAQRQTAALTTSVGGFKESLAAMIVNVAESTGAIALMTSTLNALGVAMDAIAGRSAIGAATTATVDAFERQINTLESQRARLAELERYGSVAQGIGPEAARAREELDDLRRTVPALESAIEAARPQIEAMRTQAAQAVASNLFEQAKALAGFAEAQAATEAGGGGGGASSEQTKRIADAIAAQNNARVIAEKQGIAAVNAARLQGMADSVRQFGEFAEVQAQQLRDQAALELEIEASKNAAMAELRASVKEQERRDADERRETWRSLLTDMRDQALNAGNALSQALGAALATGDGQSLRQSFRGIFAGVLADMGTMIQTIAIPMLIPSPFNPAFNPVAGGALLAAGFGLQALSGAFGAAGGGGGGGGAVSAPSASRELPTRSRDGGNTEIYQSLSFGFVGDRRAVIREVYDVLADGRRLGMAQ